jgi:hypothetical protein
MNSAPDFDISSLGPEKFAWVVDKMADLVVRLAGDAPVFGAYYDDFLRGRPR